MTQRLPIMLALPLLTVSLVASAQEEAGITNLKQKTLQMKRAKKGDQIDLNQTAGLAGISMSCYTTEGDHRIGIYVNNTNDTPRTCQSYCYYSASNGDQGTRSCNATIRGRFDGEFCSAYAGTYTYTVTDPGAFDCSQ